MKGATVLTGGLKQVFNYKKKNIKLILKPRIFSDLA